MALSYEQLLASLAGETNQDVRRQAIAEWRSGKAEEEYETLTAPGVKEAAMAPFETPEVLSRAGEYLGSELSNIIPPEEYTAGGTILKEMARQEGVEPIGTPAYTQQPGQAPAAPTSPGEVQPGLSPLASMAGQAAQGIAGAMGGAPAGVSLGGGGGMGGGGMPSSAGLERAMEARQGELGRGIAAQGRAQEGQVAAMRGQQETAQLAAEDEYLARKAQQVGWEKAEADRQQNEVRRQEFIQGEIDKVRDTVDEIQRSGVDPLNFYKHPDGSNNYGKSILAAIAVGMGALAQSRQGGPNNALNIINKAVDRDIDAQKANLANRRAGVGMQMNLLGKMQQQLGNERAAEAATRLIMTQTNLMEVEKIKAGWKGPVAQANGDMLIAALNSQGMEQKKKLVDEFRNTDVQNEAAKLGIEQQKYAARQRAAAARAKAMSAQGGPTATIPGYKQTRPFRKGEEGEVRKLGDTQIPTIDSIRNLMDVRKEANALNLSLPDYFNKYGADLSSRGQNLLMQIKDTYGLGALQQAEINMLRVMVPDPKSWGQVESRLGALLERFERKLDIQMKIRGMENTTAPTAGFTRVKQ